MIETRRPFVRGHRLLACFTALLAVTALGCTTQQLRPGTGDVSFRLLWEGAADLDLHVVDPLGRHTGIALYSPGGDVAEQLEAVRQALAAQLARERGETADGPPEGILDIDCNASPQQICPDPIENVYWPTGTAQRGPYSYWAHLFQPLLGIDQVAYTIEVRHGDAVVDRHEGMVTNDARTSERFAHDY